MKANKEVTSFKLLEEDVCEEKPTAHMKKVVGLVLDKPDLKDQDVTNSFRNLMEYREAPASPSASSATTLEPDALGSPTTPSSPIPPPVDDERLPNELLDEICEDIGMKEGMELDFVEFLMEQDNMTETYMTSSALNSSLCSQSSTTSTVKSSKCNDADTLPSWARPSCISVTSSGMQYGGSNTVASSGSSSPVAKRFHLSTSGDTSPTSTAVKQAPQQSPQVTSLPQVFKMPQTPPTPKRPSSATHCQVSQGQGQGQNQPSASSPQTVQCKSELGGGRTENPSFASASVAGKPARCFSPKLNMFSYNPQMATPPKPPQAPFSPYGAQQNHPGTLHYGQSHQIAASSSTSSHLSSPMQQKVPGVMHCERMGKMAPPVVNVQNMHHHQQQQQQQRMVNPKQLCAAADRMAMPPVNSPYGQPLDQGGYFSKRGYGDYNKSMTKSDDLNAMMQTIHQPNSLNIQRSVTVGNVEVATMPSIQKSVHFADMPNPKTDCQSDAPGGDFGSDYNGTGSNSDCSAGFDIDQEFREHTQKSKIMPRLTPSMKSEVAPYTVPGNNPYEYVNRSSCATNPNRPSSGGSPAVNMQPFDFPGKDKYMGGKGPSEGYYMDSNQNMLGMDPGDYSQMNYNHPSGYNMSVQQQQQQQQQHMNVYRGMNVTDSMKASTMAQIQQQQQNLQAMQQQQQQQQQQQHQQQQQQSLYRSSPILQAPGSFNSCSVAAMNQNGSSMLKAKQIAEAYGPQQGQGQTGQGYCAPPSECQGQSTVAPDYSGQMMNCNTPSRMTGQNSSMQAGYPGLGNHGYDQSGGYGPGNRTPVANMYQMQQQQQQQQQMPGMIPPAAVAAAAAATATGSAWTTGNPQTPQDMSHLKQAPVQQQQQQPPMMGPMPQGPALGVTPQGPPPPTCAQSGGGGNPMVPCSQPNCQSCKNNSPNRPPMLASQQTFIQHLITDRSNAFRSHPLFPLLRDLIIADMNFSSPSFPYQLISNLPAEFDKLLQNFLQRNPPSGTYQGNYAVESVIMDALRYAHTCLIEKIRVRQEQDKHTKTSSKSLSAIEEFCEKFDRAVRNSMPEQSSGSQGNPLMMGSGQMGGDAMSAAMGTMGMGAPSMAQGSFIPSMGKGIGLPSLAGPQFQSIKDAHDVLGDPGSMMSGGSGQGNKSESKKHPSLPKEAVAIMLDWLRNHKDNPYPNDDEKAMLIKQTGLTINQINYWFTNARRRILPKWAQCKS